MREKGRQRKKERKREREKRKEKKRKGKKIKEKKRKDWQKVFTSALYFKTCSIFTPQI